MKNSWPSSWSTVDPVAVAGNVVELLAPNKLPVVPVPNKPGLVELLIALELKLKKGLLASAESAVAAGVTLAENSDPEVPPNPENPLNVELPVWDVLVFIRLEKLGVALTFSVDWVDIFSGSSESTIWEDLFKFGNMLGVAVSVFEKIADIVASNLLNISFNRFPIV